MEQGQTKKGAPIAFDLEIALLEGIFKDNVVRITEKDVSELEHALEMMYTLATFGIFTRKCNWSDAFDHPNKAHKYIRDYASWDAQDFLSKYYRTAEFMGWDTYEPVKIHINRFSEPIAIIVHPVYKEGGD